MPKQFYRTNVSGVIPDPNNMVEGQIAINMRDRVLFVKDDLGQVLSFGGRLVSNGLIIGSGFVPDITKSDVAIPTTTSYGNQLNRNDLYKFQHPTRSGSWFSLDTSGTGNAIGTYDYKEYSGTTLNYQNNVSPTGILSHDSFLGYAFRDTDNTFLFAVASVAAASTNISIFYSDLSVASPVLSLSNTINIPFGTNDNIEAQIFRGYCDFDVVGTDQNTLYVWLPSADDTTANKRVEIDITNLSSISLNTTTDDKIGFGRVLYRVSDKTIAYDAFYSTTIGTTTYEVFTDSKTIRGPVTILGAAAIESGSGQADTYFLPWGLDDVRVYRSNILTTNNIILGQSGYSRTELDTFVTNMTTSLGGFQ